MTMLRLSLHHLHKNEHNSLNNKQLLGELQNIYIALFVMVVLICYVLIYKHITYAYDPHFNEQWSFNSSSGANIDRMWNYGKQYTQEQPVIVAIIDTGVDFNNKELKGRKWNHKDKNFYETYENANIESYHGTMCAEIIAASHNKYGIEGVAAYIDLEIMSLHVLSSRNSTGGGNVSDIIDAIEFAEENGAHICNLSLGTNLNAPELHDVMHNSRMLFVTSAGNAISFRGINIDIRPYYPASFDLNNSISVTCIDKSGEYSKSANYGKHTVDIAAPGIDIPAVQDNGDIVFVSGASFAVPHVTGIAAVLYAFDSNMSASQCKQYICSTAQKRESLCDRCKTGGVIDGYSALKKLMKSKTGGEKM